MIRLPGTALLLLIAGYGIWGVAFNYFYGVHAVGCAYGWDRTMLGPVSVLRGLLVGSYLLHLAAFGGLLAFQAAQLRRTTEDHVHIVLTIGFWLTVSALLASGLTALPAVVLRTCAGGPVV